MSRILHIININCGSKNRKFDITDMSKEEINQITEEFCIIGKTFSKLEIV